MNRFTLIILLLLASSLSFSQEKIFLFNGNEVHKSTITVHIENLNQKINYSDFEKIEPKPTGYFWLIYRDIDSLVMNYNRFIKTDTFNFESRSQTFEETIISADILRQESHDTMHVVDFHFVKGKLFTIQKSVNSLDRKYLSHDSVRILIHPKANLVYEDLMGYPLIEIKDSIFTYTSNSLEYLMTLKEYKQKFYGYVGSFKDKSYFKNSFLYNLLDEISVYDKSEESETFIDVFYDSSSMVYVSINYLNLNPMRGLPRYLYYKSNHVNAGKRYHKDKNTSLANLNPQTAQVFKSLLGSAGFLGMLGILEESRMDAYLLDSVLITFDFNKKEINYYLNDTKFKSKKLDLKDFWYRNEFYTDEIKKKGYFLYRKINTQAILEIDYLTGETKEVPLLNGIHGLYHWEINDGRLYILKKEYSTSWKRVLYSYNINDIRIE